MALTPGRAAVAAIALAGLVGVGACSHSAGSAGSGYSGASGPGVDGAQSSSMAGARAADAPAPAEAPTPSASVGAPAGSPAGAASAAGSGANAGNRASTLSLTLPGSSKIRTAQITIAVTHARDVSGKADRAGVIAESVGGEIDSDNRTSGKYAQADMVLRVPPAELTSVLDQLARLGTQRSRELSATDVTEKVADVSSRVTSARQTISRLRVLYADADKVSAVLAVEDDLSSREADLESLEAQQRALARQTSQATITLSLRAAVKAAVPAKKTHRSGFLGGLHRGWDAFTSAAASTADGIGAAVPFAVLVLLLGLAARLAWRRRPDRRMPPPAPDAST